MKRHHREHHRSYVSMQVMLLATLGCGASDGGVNGAGSENTVATSSAALTGSGSREGAGPSSHNGREEHGGGAGLVVRPRGEPITTERGGEVTVEVSLAARPSAAVTVSVVVSDESEAAVSPLSLVFTPREWSRPQRVRVRGLGDLLADGTVSYEVVFSAASADAHYATLAPERLGFANLDRAAFAGIGDLAGGETRSSALDVSADGTVVVGSAAGELGPRAVRWTPEGGLTALDGSSGEARAVSSAGDIIVGVARDASGNGGGARWVNGLGPQILTLNPFFRAFAVANGISGDGRVVVGESLSQESTFGAGAAGVTWTNGQSIGEFETFSAITDANESASVLVGYVLPTRHGGWEAALKNGVMLPFPRHNSTCLEVSCGFCDTPGGCSSRALAVSRDGAVIVGWARFGAAAPLALAWAPGADGSVMATVLSSQPSAEALGVSGDGMIVVGYGGGQAVRWSGASSSGIADLLQQGGVSLGGWKLTAAHAASNDGQVIVGEGINPQGNPEGWVAVLPPCGGPPDPAPAHAH